MTVGRKNTYNFTQAIIGLVPVIAVLCALTVQAQQSADTLSKVQHISDVVVTGQYGEGSISKSVYKVRVIDQKRIQQQGANNLKDVLTNELNVRVQNDPALGGSVSIQGISGQNVKIMIDGVPVVGREGGFIDLNQINLNNIERIELVEGPMSVNFGTDALGGVINLITKQKGKGYQVGATGYYETIGQYNFGVNGSAMIGKWTLSANGARNFFEGYSQDPDSREKAWKPREQYFGDLGIKRSFKNSSLRYALSAFDEKVTSRDSGTITPYYAYGNDTYFYTNRLTNSLFYDQKLSKDYNLNIVGSYNFYKRLRNKVRKDLVSMDETPSVTPEDYDTAYYHTLMSRGTLSRSRKDAKWNYQTGYETNYEVNKANRIENGSQSIYDINAFGSFEIRALNRLLIRPGVRMIYNSKFNAPIIPSLNVKWDVNSFTVIRASYGRGFRAPSLKELYLDFVDPSHNVQGNPNLQAETQNNVQLSASFDVKKYERVLRIEPSVFYNHIYNKIDLVMLDASTLHAQYNNISDYRSLGANLTADYRAPHYGLMMGFGYTGINNTLSDQTQTNTFFYSPEVRVNANYVFTKAKLTLAMFYKYNGRVQNYAYDVMSGKIVNGYINAYGLWDASATKSLLKNRLSLTAGAKNILNVVNVSANITSGVHSSASNSASIAMGRTFFVSFAYNLNWNQQ